LLKRLVDFIALSLFALPAMAQTARVQFIHNSGDIDARTLDVLIGDSVYVNDISFGRRPNFSMCRTAMSELGCVMPGPRLKIPLRPTSI
jgi:hypothetical protein